jgi:hypothetical protein
MIRHDARRAIATDPGVVVADGPVGKATGVVELDDGVVTAAMGDAIPHPAHCVAGGEWLRRCSKTSGAEGENQNEESCNVFHHVSNL